MSVFVTQEEVSWVAYAHFRLCHHWNGKSHIHLWLRLSITSHTAALATEWLFVWLLKNWCLLSFLDGYFLAGSTGWSDCSFQHWCRAGGDSFWMEGSGKVCGSSRYNTSTPQGYLNPFLAVTVTQKMDFQVLSVLLYLASDFPFGRKLETLALTGWHCSVFHVHCPYVLSETSLVQSVDIQLKKGLVRSTWMFRAAVDSVLGFSRKYSI